MTEETKDIVAEETKSGSWEPGGGAWNTVNLSDPEALLNILGWKGFQNWRQALNDTAWTICLDVLAEDIAKAPLALRVFTGNGRSEIVRDGSHPVAELFATEPNRRHSWYDWTAMMVYHLAMSSNAYAMVFRTRGGDPTEIVPVPSWDVKERINAPAREVFYEITASSQEQQVMLGFPSALVAERDVLHVRRRLIDGFMGTSSLQIGSGALRLSQAIGDYQKKLFEEDGLTRGVFVRDKEGALTDAAFNRLRASLRTLMSRRRDNNEPIVLEDGLKYEEMASTASDAELSKALDHAIVNVCRLLRMPPHKALHMNAVKYENLATIEESYISGTVMPIVKSFEGQMSRILLSKRERVRYAVEFDREELFMGDEKARTDRTEKLFKAGIITRNEARAVQRLNPDPDGDVYAVPANFWLVGRDNEVVLAPGKNGAENGQNQAQNGSETAQNDENQAQNSAQERVLRLVSGQKG